MLFVKLRQASFEITRAFPSFASVQSGDEWSGGKEGGYVSKRACKGRAVSDHV